MSGYVEAVSRAEIAQMVREAVASVQTAEEMHQLTARVEMLEANQDHGMQGLFVGGGGGGDIRPWTYVVSANGSTGYWRNGKVQEGDTLRTLEFQCTPESKRYYLVYNFETDIYSMQAVGSSASPPATSLDNGIIVFYVGELEVDGTTGKVTQISGIYSMIMLPLYL